MNKYGVVDIFLQFFLTSA